MNDVQEISVALGTRSYPIWIGDGLIAQSERWRDSVRGRHVLLISDENVAPLYAAEVLKTFDRHAASKLEFPAGELSKSFEACEAIFDALAEMGASRDATIVALGGGVIGDLAGFAAACWMRGIAFVQIPTTLLAMVDSSVGGKTAVNLPQGKNLVGAFHQPRAVVIDTSTLVTLSDRELRSGIAEVVKYGAIANAEFFVWLEANANALLARDAHALAHAIAVSCRQKAGVVARDETEQGERALLNFGHTFGHALEAVSGYGQLLHGEAIAIGMCLAAKLSATMNLAPREDFDRLRTLLRTFGLPTDIPGSLDIEAVIAAMRLDKKNISGRLRLILWRGIGRAEIVGDVAEDDIRGVLSAP
ncbi:MAG TPA: 3-dehydroquinate synthase [Rudaea sp.]|jgi:3-dehydroquinate synthase|nr:3-dehydroquinate synthase [Rudaea sp.]